MLIAKGTKCSFDLTDDTSIAAGGTTMLHDPSGKWWPKCSILFAPFRPGGREATEEETKGAGRDYLGKTHKAKVGSVELPPKDLSKWTDEGEVKEIWYTRTGKKLPFRFRHPVGKKWTILTMFKGRGKARLYSYGRYFRIQFPKGCILDGRGICWP